MELIHVRGDDQRALASGLFYVQVDKHGLTILYHLHQCRLAHHEMFHAKAGKGGIISFKPETLPVEPSGAPVHKTT